MAISKSRGYPVAHIDGEWRFKDTGEPMKDNWQDRPCGHCGEKGTPEGHDWCISKLLGVKNACCGHGDTQYAYVQFNDDRATLRHQEAIDFFNEVRA
jgi:hypothetical protein